MPLRTPLRVARFFLGDPLLFLRYVSVGAASAGLEFALFWVAYEALRWPLLLANGAALGCALVLNFTLQKQWTFRAGGEWGRRLRRYAFMQAIAALMNSALIYLMVARWGWYAPVAKLLQIGVVFGWTFSFSKLVVFRDSAAGQASFEAQHGAAAGERLHGPEGQARGGDQR